MAAITVVITGYVQGVGFRDFVRRSALVFGLEGKVWNRSDGDVEMILQHGDESHLHAFVKILPNGPGRVDSVDVEPAAEQEWDGFTIGATR